MPKHFLARIRAHAADIGQQSIDFFTQDTNATGDKQLTADEQKSPDNSTQNGRDLNGPASMLQRATALPRANTFSQWIGEDFFLCISVKEAIDLSPAVAMPLATCDSFVRVALGRPGALPLEEAETRVISRNCHPMWEECLPFPLDHVTEDTCILMRVLDKDIGHFNSFLGSMSLPLKEALDAIRKVDHEKIYRLPLLDRQGCNRKRGELVFGVAVVAKQEYKEMRGFISSIQDPDTVHDSLRDYCLHLKLHCLKELSGISTNMLAALVVEVSVCSYVVRKSLSGQLVGGELDPEGAELVVPLGPAFQDGDILKGKNRAQFGEVKVEVLSGRTRLAKTQVPIWDVPVRPNSNGSATPAAPGSPEGSDSEGEEAQREGHERRRNLTSTFTAQGDPLSTAPSVPTRSPAKSQVSTAGRPRATSPETSTRGGAGDAGMARAIETAAVAAAAAAATAAVAARRGSDFGGVPPGAKPGKDDPPAGGSGARPPWDGKRYSRRMERLDRCLNRSPVAVISMQLVKAEPGAQYDGGSLAANNNGNGNLATTSVGPLGGPAAAGGGGDGGDVFAGADVDAPSEALAVPPFPGGELVADFVVAGLGPLGLLKALFAEGSELAARVWNAEKVTDMKSEPWGPDPEGKALSVRNLSYMKPSPVGMVPVTSQQKVMVRQPGGFVVHQYATPSVPPVGQCVRVFAQVVGQHVGPNRTRFTVWIKLEWFKTGMMISALKGKVESATPKDTRKFYETLKQQLAVNHTIEEPGAAAGGGGAAGAGAAAAAVTAAASDGTAVTAAAASGGGAGGLLHHSPGGGFASLHIALLVLGGALLLTLLMLVSALVRVRGELGRGMRAVEGLSGEVEAVARALEALALRLPAAAAGEQ
ncbi:hypothetical protein PLESTB_001134800 [Pleodorina starrii]|uniref:C2 domain-containing protein n=1 Tax=Pleodorina starrii TaxID=330485 RepID=A0A9W6BR27_9CHLO|nr:hypothetical protein PLESTM_000569900 [Pleodorina starrii]GLC56687.1 hypothetical protein PLESTB_001134800 [Pleodorina starrii]GLC66845.1 hypothetical protein PLESTF_000482300 [Pleodorina starrii]